MGAPKLSPAQRRLLAFLEIRPQQPEQNCSTARRLVEIGYATWRRLTLKHGTTAWHLTITDNGRVALAKAEGR